MLAIEEFPFKPRDRKVVVVSLLLAIVPAQLTDLVSLLNLARAISQLQP